jgi:trehalose 6-phosphate synthase
VALYKHFDLLLVNAMWDGMNLVAKEGPLVNQRDGSVILSENTGAHEQLGEFALSVNPFDVQEQADAMYQALTTPPEERRRRWQQLRDIIAARTPADWIEDQLADIERKHAGARVG